MTTLLPSEKIVKLKIDRQKSLLRHHPWVFSKAINKVIGNPNLEDIVTVVDDKDQFLGYGIYSPNSQIRIRVLSFDEKLVIEDNLISERITNAINLRKKLIQRGNDGVRLVSSEGDLLSGLIVDKYNDFIVISISSCAMEKFRDVIISTLKQIYPDFSIYERSDTKSRLKEGLKERKGLIHGKLPDDIIYVKEENTIYIPVDIKNGHKTGAYLDQRLSRIKAGSLSKNATVLNCFSYTGGYKSSSGLLTYIFHTKSCWAPSKRSFP